MHASVEPEPHPAIGARPATSRLHAISVRTVGLGRPLAGTRWFPLWALLEHVGRSSGRTYRIPIVAFPMADGFLIPLPFGPGTQWLQNVVAADHARLRRTGRDHEIDRPVVRSLDDVADALPGPIVLVARGVGIRDWVEVRRVDPVL